MAHLDSQADVSPRKDAPNHVLEVRLYCVLTTKSYNQILFVANESIWSFLLFFFFYSFCF